MFKGETISCFNHNKNNPISTLIYIKILKSLAEFKLNLNTTYNYFRKQTDVALLLFTSYQLNLDFKSFLLLYNTGTYQGFPLASVSFLRSLHLC